MGESERYLPTTAVSDHRGRCPRISGGADVSRVDSADRGWCDDLVRLIDDGRRWRARRRAVDGTCLAGGAGRVAVLGVPWRALRLDVHGRSPLSALCQRRDRDRELRRRRQKGDDGEEPTATLGARSYDAHLLTVRASLPKR